MGIAFEPNNPVPPITPSVMVRLRLEDTAVGSMRPGRRHETKDVAVDRNTADGRERQMSGHEGLAGLRQLPQEPDPDADRLLRVVVERVVPVGMVEMIRE